MQDDNTLVDYLEAFELDGFDIPIDTDSYWVGLLKDSSEFPIELTLSTPEIISEPSGSPPPAPPMKPYQTPSVSPRRCENARQVDQFHVLDKLPSRGTRSSGHHKGQAKCQPKYVPKLPRGRKCSGRAERKPRAKRVRTQAQREKESLKKKQKEAELRELRITWLELEATLLHCAGKSTFETILAEKPASRSKQSTDFLPAVLAMTLLRSHAVVSEAREFTGQNTLREQLNRLPAWVPLFRASSDEEDGE